MTVMITKTSNIAYASSCVMVRAVGRHSSISMIDLMDVEIISSASECNGRRVRLLYKRPGRELTNREA